MTEVVVALVWDQKKLMICQRPAQKVRGLLWEFVGGKLGNNGIRWITVGRLTSMLSAQQMKKYSGG